MYKLFITTAEFIKKGQPTATIEITLTNEGDTAFKPETYGDHITIIRQIGTTSSYRIKNWRGTKISSIFNFNKFFFLTRFIFK